MINGKVFTSVRGVKILNWGHNPMDRFLFISTDYLCLPVTHCAMARPNPCDRCLERLQYALAAQNSSIKVVYDHSVYVKSYKPFSVEFGKNSRDYLLIIKRTGGKWQDELRRLGIRFETRPLRRSRKKKRG